MRMTANEIKEKKKNKTRKARLAWLLVASLLVGGLAITALLTTEGELFELGLVRTETTGLMLLFLLCLPLLLLTLVILWLVDSRRNKADDEIRLVIDSPVVSASASTPSPSSPVVEEAEEGAPRFCMLSRIDENKRIYDSRKYEEEISLKRFCDNFRNDAAAELRLYYDIKDIRRFIAGMAVSPIIILQGMSGTGKTSLAHAMGSFVKNTSTVIPVQPMWKERTDLLGYYNEFTKRFNETLLLEKMYEANYCKDIYVTVLDEMNIARVEYYFAEFLSLLELPNPDERYIDVVSDVWDNDPVQLKDGRIKLPVNMWFIGTANNDDSTFAISDKVYDRAMILNLDEKSERFVAPRTRPTPITAENFKRLTREAMQEFDLTGRNLKRLEELDKYLISHFHITFGNRIMKQIRQYVPVYVGCGGEELEALDDILSKKIIRKLETQNPVYLRSAAEGLCQYLDELFGYDKMILCKNAIHRLERNA